MSEVYRSLVVVYLSAHLCSVTVILRDVPVSDYVRLVSYYRINASVLTERVNGTCSLLSPDLVWGSLMNVII